MKNTTSFVLGLIGSIFGLIGSVIWMIYGTGFWGGFYSGFMGIQFTDTLSDEALGFGFIIASIQSLITIALFIVTIVKSTPNSLSKNLKSSGIWLLVLGIVISVINPYHIVLGILIIISGALALANSKPKEEPTIKQE